MVRTFILTTLLILPAIASAERSPSEQIDHLVRKELKAQGLKANDGISDETFVRRVYLEIIGRIPTPAEADEFLDETYEHKRERLIDDLINSKGYTHNFYNYWADILRINDGLGTGARQAEAAYELWLKEALDENIPYDEFVRQLVAAKGLIWENGAVGYYMRDRGMPLDNMSNTVRTFLGVRLECAQCHDHPFDKWTQMDYYKMAAFSYGVDTNYTMENRTAASRIIRDRQEVAYHEAAGNDRIPFMPVESSANRLKNDEKRMERTLAALEMSDEDFWAAVKQGQEASDAIADEWRVARAGEQQIYQRLRYYNVRERERGLKLPHDYQYSDAKPHDVVSADTMFGEDIDLENIDDTALDAYAHWMTSRENPTFTRVIANRLWKRAFGHGVFEPVDEITDQTAISNPALMDYLEQLIRDLDYDMRAFLQVLYNTETWQRAVHSEEMVMGAPFYFQGPTLRRMTAEQIWDSIVGLAIPEADHYRPKLTSRLSSVDQIRRMYASIAERTPEEYIQMLNELGDALATNRPAQDEAREKIYAAREAEDQEAYAAARKELSNLQQEANRAVNEIAYTHLGEKVDGSQLLVAMGMSEMAMTADMMGDSMEMSAETVVTRLPKIEMPDRPEGLDRAQLKRWQDRMRGEMRTYQGLIAGMARSAELDSPAPRGHFLREFGQSDREVIENAAYHASVPQALNLLNGTISEALTNQFAVFGSRVHAAGDAEEKMRMIFRTMLTRDPSEKELKLAMAEVDRVGDAAYEGVVWSLLNTQQFLFVQ